MGFVDGQLQCTTVDEQDHATGMISDGDMGVGRQIIKKLVDFLYCCQGGMGFFCGDVSKGDKDGVIDGNAII